jgi:hypothetical protein
MSRRSPLSRHHPSSSSGAPDCLRTRCQQPSLSSGGAHDCLPTRRLRRQAQSHDISRACPLELRTAPEHVPCRAAAPSHTISQACPLKLWTASEHGACPATILSRFQPSLSSGAPDTLRTWRKPRNSPLSRHQPVLWSSELPPKIVHDTPSPLSRNQLSLSSGARDCLGTRRTPHQTHSDTISPACPPELQTASQHGACHSKPTLTPSAQPVLWSCGLPRNTAHATQQPTLTPSAQPVLWSSGLPPSTAPATPSPLSRHQPGPSSGALDCLPTWRMPTQHLLRQVHSRR